MKLERFIAFRYLKSRHKVNFITIISLLSILGITVGVAALIVVLSVFNGFASIVTDILVNFDPHLKIESNVAEGFNPDKALENYLEQNKKVESFSPFVYGKSVIYSKRVIRIINLYGISEEKNLELSGLKTHIISGSYDLKTENLPKALIGFSLANRLQVSIGDTIVIVSPEGLEGYLAGVSAPMNQTFVISGIYNSHNVDIDAYNVYVSLPFAQRLLGYGQKILGYEIRLKNIHETNYLKREIEKNFSDITYSVKTWFDLHKDLYSVMLIERWSAYIILSLIIAVATFSIFSSLMMTVIEKRRDIGALKAMGLSDRSLLKIFLLEGILIGIIGSILGVILGLLICFLQIKYKLYALDPNVYIIDALPVKIQILDIVLIVLMAIFLSTIAGYFPAKRAAKQNPLEAIRWE
ncbi:MAG: ABC transporter permease [Ignavibacteria bacterium]|jgi:lipoprotein-releasing system permease protein|nr:ABC transporter permease [Ignavibacteria bacterium]MDH7527258.1 ABC transporter permease [Ignavibacteria bacterium]